MKLLGVSEIAELLGVTRQAVANWRARKPDFPTPVADLKSGPVWSVEAVTQWATEEGFSFSVPDESEGPQTATSRRAIVVALMNMKGGVGKSTIAANIGWYAAHQKDHKILLVDLDPQFNLSQYILGAEGYEELLKAKRPTVEAIFSASAGRNHAPPMEEVIIRAREWNDGSCLHLVPASLELAWSMRYLADRPHLLRDSLDEVRDRYDLILIDCSPTESILSWASYMASEYLFVPVKPEFLSTIGLPLLLRSLDEFRKAHPKDPVPEIGGIIFNDTGEKVEHDRSRKFVRDIASLNSLPVFEHEVSHSDSYPAGARVGKPIFLTEYARSWKINEFSHVAKEFLDRIGL